MSRLDRFLQPASAIHIIEKAPGPRTTASDAAIEEGRRRIAGGEDADAVWSDVAAGQVAAELGQGPRALSARRAEGAVHAAADSWLPTVKSIVAKALRSGRMALDREAFAAAAAAGEWDRVRAIAETAVGAMTAPLARELPAALHGALAAGAKAAPAPRTLAAGDGQHKLGMSFDSTNPRAVEWAKDHAGELLDDIDEATREEIADAIEGMVAGEVDRKEGFARVLDAIGDDSRAETIARTEVMTAANEGQRESWDQAVASGLLSPDARKEWIATEGGNTCPECEELDGTVVGLDEQYPGDGGDGPPLHPNCRCTEGIIGEDAGEE